MLFITPIEGVLWVALGFKMDPSILCAQQMERSSFELRRHVDKALELSLGRQM